MKRCRTSGPSAAARTPNSGTTCAEPPLPRKAPSRFLSRKAVTSGSPFQADRTVKAACRTSRSRSASPIESASFASQRREIGQPADSLDPIQRRAAMGAALAPRGVRPAAAWRVGGGHSARPRPCQEHRRRKPPGESSQHGSKGSGTILEIEAERGDASRGRCQPGPPPTDSIIGGP